jgi:hypothetical protein
VAENWRSIDKETKDYCLTVARILKERHAELSEVGRMGGLSTMDSVVAGPKKGTKHRSATSNIKNNSELTGSSVMCCIPTMDSISSGEVNEAKRKELLRRIPRRAGDDVCDQPPDQYLSMCVTKSTDPVAHEQGTMNSQYKSRTSVMGMYQQYLDNQVTTNSSRPSDFFNAEMPRPIPSGYIQQGIQGAQMNGSYGDHELEFPIITHVSQRAMISNMMSANNISYKQPMAHHDEIRSFREHRRWSAPECLETSKQEEFQAMYEAQELDISDSDVVGMWLSNKAQEND